MPCLFAARAYTSGMLPRASPPGGTPAFEDLLADSSCLVAALPFGVYVCEAPAGAVSAFNRRVAELWGRDPAAGEGHEHAWGQCRLYGPDGRRVSFSETPMSWVLRDAVSRSEDLVVERPDGSRTRVRIKASPIRDAEGQLAGAVVVVDRRAASDGPDREGLAGDSVRTLEALYLLVDRVARGRTAREVCDAGVQGILSVTRAHR